MADAPIQEYHHGEMNVATQVADYHIFAAFAKWGGISALVLILVLTLWFAVGASFLGGLVPGIIALVLAIWIFRRKPTQVH